MIILTDIHGCYKTMLALLAKIPQEEKDKGIVFCGDLIDRGPGSALIVEYVKSNNIPCVVGNHELMMIEEGMIAAGQLAKGNLNAYRYSSVWIPNGGDKCLYSYETEVDLEWDSNGVATKTERLFDLTMFKEHIEWMKSLPYVIHFDNLKDEKGNSLVVSHSSCASAFNKINFTTNKHMLTQGQKNDITWGRPHVPRKLKGKFNVFGHTPSEKNPQIKEHYANIDSGCYLNGHYNMKQLTALQFPKKIVYQQECIDYERPKYVFEELDE